MGTINLILKKITSYLSTILAKVNFLILNLTKIISDKFLITQETSKIILFFITIYIISTVILILIHNKTIKLQKNKIQLENEEYDKIWYIFAEKLYKKNQEQKSKNEKTITVNWLRSFFQEKNNNYLHNKEKILLKINQIEKQIWEKIIEDENTKIIKKIEKQINGINFFQKLVWLWITIMTIWIYRFIWKRKSKTIF